MAKLSNENIFVNIKELPQIGGIEGGDLLIVETEDGTNIMDFDDLVIDTYQTTFFGILTGNDLELSENIFDLREDLNTLTVTVDALGGTAFNSLSAQINSNIQSITALEAETETLQTDVQSLSDQVQNLSVGGFGIKAYGRVRIQAGVSASGSVSTFFPDDANCSLGMGSEPDPITPNTLRAYKHVGISQKIPGIGDVTPFVRIWDIIFPENIEIKYVDLQIASLQHSLGRRYDVSPPVQTGSNTWFVRVSAQVGATDTGNQSFFIRFAAF